MTDMAELDPSFVIPCQYRNRAAVLHSATARIPATSIAAPPLRMGAAVIHMGTYAVRRVRIPVTRDRATERPDQRPAILLVTGDLNLREVATRVLEHDGYDVVAVAHSGHALLVCLTGRRVDILATELSMEDTSGPALAERLKRHHPGLQAVYFGQPGARECDNVLVRPFTRDDLLSRVEMAAPFSISPAS